MDHTSTIAELAGCLDIEWNPHVLAVVYRLFDNMISGALYHLVATSGVISAKSHYPVVFCKTHIPSIWDHWDQIPH